MPLSSVEQGIEDFQNGKMVIIVDDEDRENEGDLAIAAEMVTAENINFMAVYARGLICQPIIEGRLRELDLPPMVEDNTSTVGDINRYLVIVQVFSDESNAINYISSSDGLEYMLHNHKYYVFAFSTNQKEAAERFRAKYQKDCWILDPK